MHKEKTKDKKYSIFDITKGLFTEDTIIHAKSPLEAIRKYFADNNKNPKCVVRDYSNTGDYVVYSNTHSFVYKEIKGEQI